MQTCRATGSSLSATPDAWDAPSHVRTSARPHVRTWAHICTKWMCGFLLLLAICTLFITFDYIQI